jgi:glycosyltransferase involved in cell wall biosynthesis
LSHGPAARPIRVLDLRDTHEVGGPGKTIIETFRAIDRSRYELHVGAFLTRLESDDTPFLRAARQAGMPVHLIRGYNQYDPRLIWRLAALVASLGIDIVHAHEVKSDAITWLASKLTGMATVTTLHGWIGNTLRQRLLIALDRRIVRRFDRVIAVSGRIRGDLHDAGVPRERVRLVHNAIVLDRYARSARRGGIAALLGREVPPPVIVSIGRMSPEKGHADLLEALAIVRSQVVWVSAVIVGDGPERPRLAAQVARLGLEDRVHLPGYLDHPERVLEDADLAVLPSHTEGLPNAALEALAMSVPVLATRVGGTPEVVTDGETGRLVEPHSPRALADALLDFAADPQPWRRMAARGREVVAARFDFAARTREMERIYAELAAGPD